MNTLYIRTAVDSLVQLVHLSKKKLELMGEIKEEVRTEFPFILQDCYVLAKLEATNRVSQRNPKLDFEVALYVFPLLGYTLTPKKSFLPLACF